MEAAVVAKTEEKKKRTHAAPESSTKPTVARKVEAGARAGMPLFLQRAASLTPPVLVQRQMDEEEEEKEPLQPKLTVGQQGDVYEQEADQVAEQVMRMPKPRAQNQIEPEEEKDSEMVQTKPLAAQITPLVQRQSKEEEEESEPTLPPQPEEEENVQAKTFSGEAPNVSATLGTRIQSQRGGGQPLPESTRNFFETRLDGDFSGVRVHTDAEANSAASELKAQAFTVGQDIFFDAGRYAPDSTVGQRLIAHELTHAIQQQGANYQVVSRKTRCFSSTQSKMHKTAKIRKHGSWWIIDFGGTTGKYILDENHSMKWWNPAERTYTDVTNEIEYDKWKRTLYHKLLSSKRDWLIKSKTSGKDTNFSQKDEDFYKIPKGTRLLFPKPVTYYLGRRGGETIRKTSDVDLLVTVIGKALIRIPALPVFNYSPREVKSPLNKVPIFAQPKRRATMYFREYAMEAKLPNGRIIYLYKSKSSNIYLAGINKYRKATASDILNVYTTIERSRQIMYALLEISDKLEIIGEYLKKFKKSFNEFEARAKRVERDLLIDAFLDILPLLATFFIPHLAATYAIALRISEIFASYVPSAVFANIGSFTYSKNLKWPQADKPSLNLGSIKTLAQDSKALKKNILKFQKVNMLFTKLVRKQSRSSIRQFGINRKAGFAENCIKSLKLRFNIPITLATFPDFNSLYKIISYIHQRIDEIQKYATSQITDINNEVSAIEQRNPQIETQLGTEAK